MLPIMINTKIIIDYLHKHLPSLQGIYLFGSYASGYANEKSDVDIAILQEKCIPSKLKFELSLDLSLLLKKDVDLVELRYVNTLFQSEIVNTSKRIATFDETACDLYENYILCHAIDFREFRKPLIQDIVKRGYIRDTGNLTE